MPLMKLDAAGGMRRPSRADMRPRKWQVIGRGAYVHNWEICTVLSEVGTLSFSILASRLSNGFAARSPIAI